MASIRRLISVIAFVLFAVALAGGCQKRESTTTETTTTTSTSPAGAPMDTTPSMSTTPGMSTSTSSSPSELTPTRVP